jgi:hypothetical protein
MPPALAAANSAGAGTELARESRPCGARALPQPVAPARGQRNGTAVEESTSSVWWPQLEASRCPRQSRIDSRTVCHPCLVGRGPPYRSAARTRWLAGLPARPIKHGGALALWRLNIAAGPATNTGSSARQLRRSSQEELSAETAAGVGVGASTGGTR